jgi:RTX calcium-binding nonapeptide repeat (4 copies)
LRTTTKTGYATRIEVLRTEHGHRSVAGLTQERINTGILQPYADRPGAQLSILKMLRILIRHAMSLDNNNPSKLRYDPSAGINPLDVDFSDLPSAVASKLSGVSIPLTSLAVAAGGSAGSNAPGIAGSVDINIFDTTTHALVDSNATVGQAGTPNGSLTVSAIDTTVIKSGAGSVGVGISGSGIGAGLDLAIIDKDTRAYIGQNALVKTSGLTSVTATSSEDLLSISANAGVGGSAVGLAGSASVEIVTTATRAYIEGGAQVTNTGGVNIDAGGTLGLTLVAGSIGGGSNVGGGAAVTTLVHNDTVEAFIGSGATVTTSLGPNNILINAHSTETEVAIGAAGGVGGSFGLAGSVVVNILNETTRAYVDRSSTVNAGGNLTIHADDQSKIISVAGTLSISGNAAVGAGADVATVTKHTDAFIESDVSATIGGNIDLKATSAEKITSIAAGIAASGSAAVNVDASVHVLNVTTRAFIGDDPDLNGSDSAGEGNVHATGSISIRADEHTELDAIVGMLSLSGSAAVTAGAVVTVTNKHTDAFVGQGARVTADGVTSTLAGTGGFEFGTIANGGPQGDIKPKDINGTPNADTLAAQGKVRSPTVPNADSPTVDDGSGGNQRSNPGTSSSMLGGNGVTLKPGEASFSGLAISATNYDQINGYAAGLAGSGTVSVAVTGVVNAINNDTNAYVGSDAVVNASGVSIGAANDFHHLAVAAAVAIAGAAGVAPAVDVSVVTATTKAEIRSGAQVTATSGDIAVIASAKEDMLLVGVGIAGGTVGFGAGVSVLVVNNTTNADIGGTVDAYGNVQVRSSDDTDITIVDGAGGFGLGGIGASVGVISMTKHTNAFVADGAIVHARANAGDTSALAGTLAGDNSATGFDGGIAQGLVVEATSHEHVFHLNVALGGGFIGAAGGVTVSVLSSETHAYIGDADINLPDGGSANARQDVVVNAANDARVTTFAGGIAGGAGAISGAVDVGVLHNNTNAEIMTGARVVAKDSVRVNALGIKDIDSISASGSGGVVALAGSISVWSVGQKLAKNYTGDGGAPDNALDSGSTSADGYAAGQGQAGGDNIAKAIKGGDADPNGDPNDKNVGITNGTTDPKAAKTSQDRTSGIAYQSLSGTGGFSSKTPNSASLQGSFDAEAGASPGTNATIGGGAEVTATSGNIIVNAVENLHMTMTQGGVAVGLAGIGAGVGVLNVASNVSATAGGTLSAGGAINVHANLYENIDDLSFAGTLGLIALGGAVVVVNDTSTTTASIADNAIIHKATTIDVQAAAEQHLSGLTVGVNVGAIGAGASFTKIDVHNDSATDVLARVGKDVSIGQGANDSVDALKVNATSSTAARSTAFGLSGGIVGVGVNFSFVTIKPDVVATIDTGALIKVGKDIQVEAHAHPEGDTNTIGIAVGGLAFASSKAHTTVEPTVTASIRALNAQAGGNVTIAADASPAGGGVPTYTIASTNTGNDTIHVLSHGLLSGDVIQFNGSGQNLVNGREYSVIVTSPEDLSFGATFKGGAYTGNAGVDLATSTIHFAADHNLQTGDQIKYVAPPVNPNPPPVTSGIDGLTSGATYYVIRVDARTIRLATYNPLAVPEHNLSSFTPVSGNTITVNGSNFSEGEAVTYHAPPGGRTFGSMQVDVTGAVDGDGHVTLADSTGANNIQFFRVTGNENDPNEGKIEASGFNENDLVYYSASNAPGNPVKVIGGLRDGGVYKAVNVNNSNGTLQLHAYTTVTATFNDIGDTPTSHDTITRSSGNWADDGFQVGQTITVTGTVNNNKTYTIFAINGSTIQLANTDDVTGEGPLNATFESSTIELTADKDPTDSNGNSIDPDGSILDGGRSTVHSFVLASNAPMKFFDGSNNVSMDGRTFYVRNPTTNTFQIALTPGGSVLSLTAAPGASGNHKIGPENVGLLSTGAGIQTIRIDLTDPNVSGTLLGEGGVPLNQVSPPTGDGESSSKSSGSTGGVIAAQFNTSTVDFNTHVSAYLSGQVTAGDDVRISGTSTTNANARAINAAGGFIGVGAPSADSDQNVHNDVYVDGRVTAGGDFRLEAFTQNQSRAYSRASSGGLVGVAVADADSAITYSTTAKVYTGSNVLAGGTVRITGDSKTSQTTDAIASGIGLGGDGNASTTANVTGTTEVDVLDAAAVIGKTVLLAATVSQLSVHAHADGRGGGFVAIGTAVGDVTDNLNNNVTLANNALVTGVEGVDFRTRYDGVDTHADTFARATGLFGAVHSDANNSTTLNAKITGGLGALVTAGPRDVTNSGADAAPTGPWDSVKRKLANIGELDHLAFYVDMTNSAITARHDSTSSKRSLAVGGDNKDDNGDHVSNTLDFNSNVLILSGRSPELHVASNGTIDQMVNLTAHIDVPTSTVIVDDIFNDDPGQVFFSSGGTTVGSIVHTLGVGNWEFRDTFNHVRLINESKLNLQVNDIKVVNTTKDPIVDLRNTSSLDVKFNIKRTVAPTLVDVENLNVDPPNVVINGIIENPIGTTRITVTNGNIFSTSNRVDDNDPGSLIRTNILDLEAKNGNIGTSTNRINVDVVDSKARPEPTTFLSARANIADNSISLGDDQFFTGELVKYESATPLGGLMSGYYYYAIVSSDGQSLQLAQVLKDGPGAIVDITSIGALTDKHTLTPAQRFTVIADGTPSAAGNAYLDVKARLRDTASHVREDVSNPNVTYNVIIDAVNTSGNADLLLRGSVQETNVSAVTYPGTPAGKIGGILIAYPGGPAFPGERHFTFFKSPPADGTDGGPLDPGVFANTGASATHIDSTYDIRAYDGAGKLFRAGITSERSIIIAAAEPFAGSTKIINVYGITEIKGGGAADPGDVHHVDVLTNGDITIAEKTDDLRVGEIRSTLGNVTLNSPAAIIDALKDGISPVLATADVTAANNITMTAGNNLIGDTDDKSGRGGIGTPGNFLEVNVDSDGVVLGVINATDTASATTPFNYAALPFNPAGTGTYGVFLTETVGDMKIDIIQTKGDVALSSVAGSLVDRSGGVGGDDAANVIGNTINLFANGGNIGDTTGGDITNPQANGNNDLEIDSQAYAYGRIAARATGSIYLTETLPTTASTFNDAQVVLLQSLGTAGISNVRFTVRESAAQGEDLNLLAFGPALFLENATETIAHGLINAANGSILLRVGDNITTDPNSQILASRNVDIYGDFARTTGAHLDVGDPGYGTIMHLHGVVAHGPTASGFLTRIFGNADTDQIYFDKTFLGGNSGTATSTIPGGGSAQTIPDGFIVVAGFPNAGHMSDYSGGATRAYGSNLATPTTLGINATVTFAQDPYGDTITRSSGDFAADGFAIGDVITVDSGIASDPNNRSYTITGVSALVLTLSSARVVTPASNISVKIKNTRLNPFAPTGDSEDFFVVNQLQSMQYVQTGPMQPTSDTLTLDGQAGTDTYVVNTTGTHGDVRNYVINVLDTGGPLDGVNNLSVYGNDSTNADFIGAGKPFDDIFLLRRTTDISHETGNRPGLYANESAFVAVLDYDPTRPLPANGQDPALTQAQASDVANDGTVRSESVQRINYDSSINGRLMVFGQGGNDYFAVDDNAATTTLDGGSGNDSFQIGQIYGYQRDGKSHEPAPLGNTAGGSIVTPADLFPQLANSLTPQSIYGTVATTRGWLSAGATSPLVAEGGSGDDTFTVYSNQAVLRLEGDDGNDLFTVRAFALAQTDPVSGDIVWLDPVQEIAMPKLTKGFSTAAETAIRTGAGSNQVEYNINAPVSVDGGSGFDKLVILGTEFADHIVVTDKGVFGAGLTVTYQNIEVLEVDALEGDDTIDVLSTKPRMAVRVIGGLGNDAINVAGDVAGDVVSRDINGTSSTINQRISTSDGAYKKVVPDGISLSVSRPDQGQVIIDENVPHDLSPGATDVTEGAKINNLNPADDVYGIRLGHVPVVGTFVYVTVSAAMNPEEEHVSNGALVPASGDIIDTLGLGDSILLASGNTLAPGDKDKAGLLTPAAYARDVVLNGTLIHVAARAIVLVFDSTNWDKEQYVHVMAVDDSLAEGDRTVAISHTVLSNDPTFDHAIVRNVEVTIHDNDQPAIKVTQLDATVTVPDFIKYPGYGRPVDGVTKVLEGTSPLNDPPDLLPPITAVDDYFAVELATKPIGTVQVAINPQYLDPTAPKDLRVSLSSADARFHVVRPTLSDQDGVYYITFDAGNWNQPVIVTTHAVQRLTTEDPHDTTITATVVDTINGDLTADTAYKNAAVGIDYSGPTLTFVQSVTGDTITRSSGSWIADGYKAGQNIIISGTQTISDGLTNNALFVIKSVDVTGTILTLTTRLTVIPAVENTAQHPVKIRINGSGISQTIDAQVIDDGAAGLFTLESGGNTLVSAGTASQGPGKPDTYTMRLTKEPQTTVNVDVITDGQTDILPDGGQITLHETGFTQNLTLFTKGNISVGLINGVWTISRAPGSELGSFIADGFLPGQTITIHGTGPGGVDGTYKIDSAKDSVKDQTIKLTNFGGAVLPSVSGTFNTTPGQIVSITNVKSNGVYNNGNVQYTVADQAFLMFTGNIQVNGTEITRSDIGSFVNDNFAHGEIIRIQRSDGSIVTATDYIIDTVTDKKITLTTTTGLSGDAGKLKGASISEMLDTLVRTDGSSWLDSGFFEGQLVRITPVGGSTPVLVKIDLITGTDAGKLDKMVLTDHPEVDGKNGTPLGLIPYSGRPPGGLLTTGTSINVDMMQMAVRVEFEPTGFDATDSKAWYKQATISVQADPYFDIQPGHENLRAFPKASHTLSGIRGPLAVEGGTTSADRSLVPAVLLPGEANGPFFNIPPQPPETQSIDVLNIFSDGTQGAATGTLTSTALTGLNMNSAGLDFTAILGGAHPFGESGKYPGGISYGSIVLAQDPAFPGDPTKQVFLTDGSHSTLEVVNLFLGQGNDKLDINSTLIPGPDHNADGTLGLVSEHGGLTTVHGGGNAPLQLIASNGGSFSTYLGAQANTFQLVRSDGTDWAIDGFAVGQQVLVTDAGVTGSYTIIAIGNPPAAEPNASHKPGSALTLFGAQPLPIGTKQQGTISVIDQLAVVSGQKLGNQTTGTFQVTGAANLNRIVRDDGLTWASLGFAVGQQVSFSIGGLLGTRTVLGFDNAAPTSGFGSVLILSGAPLTGNPIPSTAGMVAVSSRNIVSTPFALTKTTITRSDVGGNWIADGFAIGQAVAIGGQKGYWLVSDEPTATTLTLEGADLPAAVQKVAIVRIGGDTINVNGSSEVVTGSFDVAAPAAGDPAGTADRLTRNDGHTWDGTDTGDSAFAVGQQVTISATFSFPQVTFARNVMGDTITRSSGSWLTDGFAAGQTIVITDTTSTNGSLTNNGSFTIASVSSEGKILTLTAANTVVPTSNFGATEPAKISLYGNFIVTGFANQVGTTGHFKTLLVNGAILPRQAAVPMTVNVDAPLVVYGDTSQDGVWYNGVATQQSLGKFANKPQPHMDNVNFTLASPSVPLVGFANVSVSPAGGVQISAAYTGFNTVSVTDDTFGNLKRADGGSWVTDGFKVNGLVTIGTVAVGTVYGFKSSDPVAHPTATDVLVLNNLLPGYVAGSSNLEVKEWNTASIKLTSGQYDPGFVPEGLIAIGKTYSSLVFARSGGGDTITRSDAGGSWVADKFAIGQSISISGTTYNDGGGGPNYVITGVTATQLTLAAVQQLIPTAQGALETARISIDVGTIAEIGTQYQVKFSILNGQNVITRTDGGSWSTDGFTNPASPDKAISIALYGAAIETNDQVYKVLAVAGDKLIVDKAVTSDGNSQSVVLSGGPVKRDTLYLANLRPGALALLNGGAPQTNTIVERNRLGQNADFFVFPLAAQYQFDGNDVIDAHNLFAGIADGRLPTVGITAYGGRGDDTIIGSAANDFLAGGSGNDTIIGGRGGDQIYGDSGINVDVIRRLLTVANAAGTSGAVNVDPIKAGNDLIYGDAPGSTAINAFGDYNDIIFADLGDVRQDVSGARDTTKPVDLKPQRIETTLRDIAMASASRQNGGNDTVYGNGGEDILIGGTGDDAIDGGTDRDLVFGDNASLDRTGHFGNYSNLRFETLTGTQIYSTAPANAGQDQANNLPQADPRGHGAWGDYLITMFDTLPDLTKSVTVDKSFGNDYIAGGSQDDMIFGQAGNDTAQGDGSIDYVSHVLIDNGLGLMVVDTNDKYGGRVGVVNVGPNYAQNPFRTGSDAGNPNTTGNNLMLRASFDGATDGQDYIEGNVGNDLLLGNQNQDDLVGGNSNMFSLATSDLRPDGSDLIFGGSGVAIARNAIGDAALVKSPGSLASDPPTEIQTTTNGHANDADAIVGDNGNIIRLVGTNGNVAPPVGQQVVATFAMNADLTTTAIPTMVQSYNGFLRFNYDTGLLDQVGNLKVVAYDDTAKIVVRAVRPLDYTQGGPDFNGADPINPAIVKGDIGSADEIHGESGDDFIYGLLGNDWLFGEGQSDDIIGGYGNDWISGGTGDDGIIGDDGRIYTSRNSLNLLGSVGGNATVSIGEPLNGIAPLLSSDADPKYSNGNALNEFIFTPGNMQIDTINVSGALKKTVDLTPFSSDPSFNGTRDDFSTVSTKNNGAASDGKTRAHNDDIIFGGLGSDWIHGGSGDDAISGAESLKLSYTQIEIGVELSGIAETDYYHPYNPGDALRFNPVDPDGKFTHPHIAGRTGEFALYDENEPMRKVLLNNDGSLNKTGSGKEFFLNFDQTEGVLRPGGTTQGNQNQSVPYGPVRDDGNDAIFGDNGNDWIVGGTGRDHTYGGWGNDLLNADDDLTTAGSLNNVPETHPTYEDRAYGGAGKDVLIANTGGDRLIDWVGEYNSYLVPFSEFGMATVSRTMQPFLHHFLYAESLSDGVDATRYSDLNGGARLPVPTKNNDPNPGRNGEPAGELGLVLQQDDAWHAQTGAPTDPQAGNTPGTQRDVLRSASYAPNTITGMFADSGSWSVVNSAYQNSTTKVSGDNISLFDLDTWLPANFYEVQSIMKVQSGGTQQNGFIIFDYQGPTNFKYAGIDIKNNQLKIGQRSDTGWNDLAILPAGKPTLGLNSQNTLLLTVNGTTATLSVASSNAQNTNVLKVSYTFNAPLNTGMLGVGTNNSIAAYTSYTVQRLPVIYTYSVLEDLSDGVAQNFTPATGTWTTTSGTNGAYTGTPPANDAALTVRPLAVAPLSYVEYSATVKANAAGTSAGLTFAYNSTNAFLYAGIVAGTNQVVIGHRDNGVWVVDASTSATINAGTNYTLLVALTEGTTNTVNVVLNGKSVLSYNYNILVHDGSVGLYARNGNASFDNVLIRGDDIAYAGGGAPQVAAVAAPPATDVASVTADELASIVATAKGLWTSALGAGDPRLATLDQVTVLVADLPDGMLGATTGTTIVLDGSAAGWGWFVDPTPNDNSEFQVTLSSVAFVANPSSPAFGRMDLLTTVLHEMGNAMGFAEDQSHDVTGMVLQAGERRVPVGDPQLLGTAHTESGTGAKVPASTVVVGTAPASTAELSAAAMPQQTSARGSGNTLGLPSTFAGAQVVAASPEWTTVGKFTAPTALADMVPVSSVALRGAVASSPTSGTAGSGDLRGSFVSVGQSLTADLTGAPTSRSAPAPVLPQTDPPAAEYRSSRLPDSANGAPTINWDSRTDASDHLASGPSGQSQDWLDDFLNHLGTNETQRNPNAGIRVRPTPPAVHTAGHA